MKKFLGLAALAALTASPAFAVTNLDFESGTSGWTALFGGSVNAVSSFVYDPVDDADGSHIWSSPETWTPMQGSAFGLFTLNDPVAPAPVDGSATQLPAFFINFQDSGQAAAVNDKLYFRFASSDYFYGSANTLNNGGLQLDDSVKFTFTGSFTGQIEVEYSVNDLLLLNSPDSGWNYLTFVNTVTGAGQAPVGTTSILIQMTNYYDNVGVNKPLLAVDYQAAPVPEPESYAMLLAGLGALGFVARRRQRR